MNCRNLWMRFGTILVLRFAGFCFCCLFVVCLLFVVHCCDSCRCLVVPCYVSHCLLWCLLFELLFALCL